MLWVGAGLVVLQLTLTWLTLTWWFGGFENLLRAVFKTREIHKPEGLYLRRFYLSPRVRWLPFQIFLHHILLDDDRHLHDHPWDFVSVILRGGYREDYVCRGTSLPTCTEHCKERLMRNAMAGSILVNRAEHTHRVEIIKPVWSLVIARRPRRKWGFWTDGKDQNGAPVAVWTPADKFLKDPHVYDHAEDRL